MDEGKKKKRNKKKKSKQNNHTNNNNINGQNHGSVNDNQFIEVSSNGDVVDAEDFNGHYDKPKGAAPRSTALQETNKHLQNETDSLTRTQDTFEETIKRLQDENDSHIQKEHEGTYCVLQATLEETVKQLQNESASYMQKEASLEDTINQLRSVNNLCIQKEATFEDTIKQLKTENDSHQQKEAGFGEKLNHLQDEKAALVLKAASIGEKIRLLESDKDSWTLSENTTKETIARMNIDITRLRMQVVELEDSRNSLVKENQQLKESMSDLKLQPQNINTRVSFANTSDLGKLGSEKEELNSQIEAACALVDKLITENADLVEKVNELYIKLDHQRTADSFSSATGRGVIVRNSEIANGTHPMADSNANLTALGHKLESLEVEPAVVVQYPSEAGSGEIVQIPLDDNEVPDLEMQAAETDDKSGAVPLTDAPLIGAPFRLISFVAKYVSGGDLVNKDDSD
ncbi:PREDICTED: rho-associated protein kinase 2 isoform X2 [Populus euphratica]|uniref:Rho-associated protein kinase 2 isoform X2 n=1 Tax=Populus euphratica TaxID=75702 RepID=A0AAJ6TXH0_POPEU|nr:PREDICTED: rho-associated protein kinase 2 isoform X2 [Populus euphratica]